MSFIPWWVHYPNVNNEILNLDWLLKVSNCNTQKIENFINLNTIKYADPILWDITSQYECNTIVVDPQTGDAYISTEAVPYGVSLSNDDYWTKIYNYADAINGLEEQIAIANERLSTTASAARSVGDLVWLDGKLYKITAPMIAGDSYVVDSNCIKTTIEKELKIIDSTLTTEIQNRTDADTALGIRIDDEELARANADTALGDRIDNLNAKVDGSRNYVNVLYPLNGLVGLDNTGASDNTLKLQNIVNYYGANVTYFFPCGTYLIEGTISVSFRHVSFIGEQRAGVILIHSSNVNMFEITNVNFVYFEHLFFRNTNTAPTSSAYFLVFAHAPYCVVNDVSMYNSCRYIKFDTCLGSKCYDVQMNNDEIFPTATVMGILLTGRCVSSRFIRVTMNFLDNPTAFGIYCIDYAQDIYIQRFETTGCVNAVYFYNTTANNPGDIIIRDCIFDFIKGPAIRLHDLSTVDFHNTNIIDTLYITPYIDNINCIRLDNVDNIIINNVGINNPNKNSAITGISINGGNNVNVSDSMMVDIYRALAVVSETKNVKVNNCNYNAYSIANGAGIVFNAVKRGSITNNNIVGAATDAIIVNGTCEKVIIALNNISSGSITDAGVDSLNINNITN